MKELVKYKYWILAVVIVVILVAAFVVNLQRGNTTNSLTTNSSTSVLSSESVSSQSSESKAPTTLGENKATRLGESLNPIDAGREIQLDTFSVALDDVYQDGPTTIVYLTLKNKTNGPQTFASLLQMDVQNTTSSDSINNQNAAIDYEYLSKNFIDFQLDATVEAGKTISGAVPYRVLNKSRMYIVFNDSNLERSKEYFLVKE
jgi:hypothetical protein